MNVMKNKFIKNLFYKRNHEKSIVMSRNIKDSMKEGDTFRFYGNLYSDNKNTKEYASTIIDYKILLITSKGVLIETVNKYTFNDKSTLKLKGKIFSPNFSITNGNVNLYKTEQSYLLVTKGTNMYENAYGYAKYIIDGNGIGNININIDLISKK